MALLIHPPPPCHHLPSLGFVDGAGSLRTGLHSEPWGRTRPPLLFGHQLLDFPLLLLLFNFCLFVDLLYRLGPLIGPS